MSRVPKNLPRYGSRSDSWEDRYDELWGRRDNEENKPKPRRGRPPKNKVAEVE